MPLQKFDGFLFENALKDVGKNIERQLDGLGLNLSDISDDDALSFLNAVISHDGDIKKVKKTDLNESFQYEEPLNEGLDVLDILGKMGEVIGMEIGVEFMVAKIAKRLGKNLDPGVVEKKVHTVFAWINGLSGIQSTIIKRGFEFVAKIFGAKVKNQKLFGRIGLIVSLAALLICSLMVFPALGSGGLAIFIAALASAAKVKEIYNVCVEIWELIKAPAEADLEKYEDFFNMIGHVAVQCKEKYLVPHL